MIIQPNVHSCAFLIFTNFSVNVLYNVPLELYNVPLDTKMAAFKSSHFSLAYTGRRDSTGGFYLGANSTGRLLFGRILLVTPTNVVVGPKMDCTN